MNDEAIRPPGLARGLCLASRIIALMMAIATTGLVLRLADITVGTSLFLLLALAWCVSPYATIAFALRRPWAGAEASLVAFATTVGVSGLALYVYSMAFFVKPDPQSGLVFLFIPLWQWMGVVAGLGVAWLVQRRTVPNRDRPQ